MVLFFSYLPNSDTLHANSGRLCCDSVDFPPVPSRSDQRNRYTKDDP